MSSFHCALQSATAQGDKVECKGAGGGIGFSQLIELERSYNNNPHPTTAEVKKLAKTLQCNEKIVGAWFKGKNKKKKKKAHEPESSKYYN